MTTRQRSLDLSRPPLAVADAPVRERREARQQAADWVEYSVYPRTSRHQRTATGLAIDRSASGLCVSSRSAEDVGTVLRVVVRGVDGAYALDSLARVTWCRGSEGGRFRLGLAIITDGQRRARSVRPADIAETAGNRPSRLALA